MRNVKSMKLLGLQFAGLFALALVNGCLVNDGGGSNTPTTPVITSQPLSLSAVEGTNVQFSVTASGTGLTYQWQENNVNLTDGGGISGTTTNTMTITNVQLLESGNGYRCVVTNSVGSTNSNPAVLTVTTPAVAITSQPVNVTVLPNCTATFSVTATGAVSYQWSFDSANVWRNVTNRVGVTGATTNTLTITGVLAVEGGTVFRCVVTGTSGSVTSNTAILFVDVAVTTLTMSAGAQGNDSIISAPIPPGSFLDMDLMWDFKESEVTFNGNDGEIDLFFGFGLTGSTIYSPLVAKNGGFNIAQSLTPANSTDIRAVTVTNFGAITSKAQVDALWLSSTRDTDDRLPIATGTSYFLVKTDLDLIVLVQVSNLTSPGNFATVTLTGKAYF